MHQIPATPAYARVKVGRRLARLGAVALKNAVYVLPRSDAAQEDFEWVLREIVAAGGEAILTSCQLVDGLRDSDVEALFRAARDEDYRLLNEEARAVEARFKSEKTDELCQERSAELDRLERRMAELATIDFFEARGRATTERALTELRARLMQESSLEPPAAPPEVFRRRVWVTRTGIHVDRIASAWLIQRFIDPEATFKFVPTHGSVKAEGELRFDMFQAEFSHEGELCTFEVLCQRFSLRVPGLRALAELIHDIDLKDGKFGRAEAPGLAAQILGLCEVHRSDEARLTRGKEIFEELLAHFARRGA